MGSALKRISRALAGGTGGSSTGKAKQAAAANRDASTQKGKAKERGTRTTRENESEENGQEGDKKKELKEQNVRTIATPARSGKATNEEKKKDGDSPKESSSPSQ